MNFKHLHYFWVAAKAGGVMKAGEQLHTTNELMHRSGAQLQTRKGGAVEPK